MTESPVISIEITKEISFDKGEDNLYSRLRKVTLRGFPVKIYENAIFEKVFLTKDQISNIYTPQLRVYQTNLDRVARLSSLFKVKGIDILNLDKAYDYIARHESGEETEWTILPPIVERWHIPKTKNGKLDYATLLENGQLKDSKIHLNPQLNEVEHSNNSNLFDIINDGSHRIHYGFENGGITILRIIGAVKGYPYYAAPQRYNVKVFRTREEALKEPETKIHVFIDPHHKKLYRVFPSGGIKSGDVRPQ